MPESTPPGRWPMSTCPRRPCRTRTRVHRTSVRRSFCRCCAGWAGSCRPTSGSSTSSAPLRVSTPGSRRCGVTTCTGCRRRRGVWIRSRSATSPPGRARGRRGHGHRLAGPVGIARLRRVLPSPRERHHHPRPAAAGVDARGRPDHRAGQRRRVLLVDGALLVGALLAVGEHRRPVSWCRELLSATARSSDYATAPAHGLTLVGVDYPPDDQLAARNLITRDVRSR